MSSRDLHVVLGAGGGMGHAVVQALIERGCRVRAVQRRAVVVPPGVEAMQADVATVAGAKQACAGAAVVYHCANAPYHRWPQELLPLNRAILEGAAAASARLVVGDNLYMYGPVEGRIAESLPETARTRKGRLRALATAEWMAAERAGRVRVTIGRASDFYGPAANSAAGEWLFRDVLAGKPASWLASLDQPHTMSYLPDVGRALAVLGERPEAEGQVWHLPASEALTGRQFLTLVFSALGMPARMSVISRPMVMLLGLFVPFIRETGEMMYQWDRPFVLDDSKFRAAFGPFTTMPHTEGVRATVAWYREKLGAGARD
jgi:nucleoside-diphosphate-sugar epimerase